MATNIIQALANTITEYQPQNTKAENIIQFTHNNWIVVISQDTHPSTEPTIRIQTYKLHSDQPWNTNRIPLADPQLIQKIRQQLSKLKSQ